MRPGARPRIAEVPPPRTAWAGRTQVACGAILLVLLAAWTVHLLPQWLHQPDLSHGLFTPIVFIILIHEARVRGLPRMLPTSPSSVGAIGLLGAASLLGLATAGLFAAALEWSHPLVEFLLAGALCGLLSAAWLTAALDQVRLLPCNWPAAVGILVWALSAPLPPGSYTRLTQQLETAVTAAVLFALHLLGIAAAREGNVIDLAHSRVGVEEACSGVRSLLSCIYAGFFLSAVLSHRPWKRALLILLSGALALVMNFLRSLLLTLLANAGVEIEGTWHDWTGFGILAVTAALLAGTALMLERLGRRPKPDPGQVTLSASSDPAQRAGNLDSSGAQNLRPPMLAGLARASLLATLILSLGALVFFVVQTRPAHPRNRSAPDLWALLPETTENWEVTTRTDLYRFSSQLQTDVLAERTYAREDRQGSFQITVYLAYWAPGQASVSLVESHTPDACWPGSGWVEDRARHQAVVLSAGSIALPPGQFRAFKWEDFPQQVWYWHLFEGKPIEGTVGSARQLLSLAWHYGFRNQGEQVFARISSNREWAEVAGEPLIKEILHRAQPLGL